VSCGSHDVVTLESRGIPSVLVGTAPFRHEAQEQVRVLGMPDLEMVELPHPIQPLPPEVVAAYADDVIGEIVRRLTG
jgi:hypothetical protein